MASFRHTTGTPVDTTAPFTLFTFNHVGVVGYSKDFGSLHTEKMAGRRRDGSRITREDKWQFNRRPGSLPCFFTCREQDAASVSGETCMGKRLYMLFCY
ncbi:hypothetical protein IMZ48_01845 [Candidatus Bathyarchaeota archaeon]|nr:hypothetical protein [Candidatus Bathyarchaeota archaeon]